MKRAKEHWEFFKPHALEKLSKEPLKNIFLLDELQQEIPRGEFYFNPDFLTTKKLTSIVYFGSYFAKPVALVYSEREEDLLLLEHQIESHQEKSFSILGDYDTVTPLFYLMDKGHQPARYFLFVQNGVINESPLFDGITFRRITYTKDNAKLLREALQETYKGDNRFLRKEYSDKRMIQIFEEKVYQVYHQDKPIGIYVERDRGNGYVEIYTIWIASPYRRKGYSNAILERAVKAHREKEKDTIILLNSANFGLIRLIEKENFDLIKVYGMDRI